MCLNDDNRRMLTGTYQIKLQDLQQEILVLGGNDKELCSHKGNMFHSKVPRKGAISLVSAQLPDEVGAPSRESLEVTFWKWSRVLTKN